MDRDIDLYGTIRVHTTWQVDRNDKSAGLIDPANNISTKIVQFIFQAVAEDGVDNHIRPIHFIEFPKRNPNIFCYLIVGIGVFGFRYLGKNIYQNNVISLPEQVPGYRIPVSAVVSLAAQNHDPSVTQAAGFHFTRHGGRGVLH